MHAQAKRYRSHEIDANEECKGVFEVDASLTCIIFIYAFWANKNYTIFKTDNKFRLAFKSIFYTAAKIHFFPA